jgi:ATP-binding cassette subfamily E protein 1
MAPKKKQEEETLTRIAIVNPEKCKPSKCRQECKKSCPVVRMGKFCIEVTPKDKLAFISEELCIGCNICVKKCPFEAVTIINLPKNLNSNMTHRYSANSFKLHRLPSPRAGQVLGLVGTNGIGKSTALKILAGKMKPNLGQFASPPDWQDILNHFRGSELQNYFTKILEDDIKAIIKPQYVDHIPKAVKGKVVDILKNKDERDVIAATLDILDLHPVSDREVDKLSGGELQRFAIGVVIVQKADVYMFDEPSSYLDVMQRLKAARAIRSLLEQGSYVIVVEHDLSVLDYLSDFICCLYGVPGAYGVVTLPFSVREGINIFLAGFIPTENLRFRQTSLTFKVAETADQREDSSEGTTATHQWPAMTKKLGEFQLNIEAGSFSTSEIVVMLGQNGTGKTTFIKMLAGISKPDGETEGPPLLNVSYKPQTISPKFEGTVRMLLHKKIRDASIHPQFISDVMKPMLIDPLLDQEVKFLSGGELQRVALVIALGTPADIYLIDEPSAYLDSEQRITAAKVIKRFIMHAKKTGFIVEHDFIMATYLADRVVVYEGTPSVNCTATTPQPLLSGMNKFLTSLEVTFRRDPENYRPRINKLDSVKDVEQKSSGQYFFMDD